MNNAEEVEDDIEDVDAPRREDQAHMISIDIADVRSDGKKRGDNEKSPAAVKDTLSKNEGYGIARTPKTQVRKWEKRWVLVPNVFQFGEDIWVQKWVNDNQIKESNQRL